MHCIIITRKLSKNEINKIRNIAETEPCEIYSYKKHKTFQSNLLNKNVNDNVEEECLKYLNEFGHVKRGDQTLIDWLSNNQGSSYWYYLRFTLFFIHFDRMKEKNLIESINNTYNKTTVFCNNKFSDLNKTEFHTPYNKKAKLNFGTIAKFIILFTWRVFIGLIQHFTNSKNKNVIALEPYNRNKILNISNNNEHSYSYGDYYNHYLTEKAYTNDNFRFLSDFYHPDFTKKLSLNKNYFIPKYKTKTQYFEFYIFLTLLNPFNLKKVYSLNKQINKIPKPSHEDKLLNEVLKRKKLLFFMIIREEASRIYMKLNAVKSFTCHHEQSYHHQSIINGAKYNYVPTIGFQHGTVHHLHTHYMYSPKDAPYNPIPDYMFTWGEHWKNILTKHSIYNPKETFVLGQLRTDIIPYLQKKKTSNKRKKIILASQTDQIGVNNRLKMATDFLHLSKAFPDIDFLIKPHPYEKDPKSYFNNIAKEIGTTNYSIIFDDLYEALSEIDMLMTFHSTVASEAIYFKKPVLIYNFANNDRDNYLKHIGATFGAENYDQLKHIIKQFNNNTLNVNENIQNTFIKKFTLEITGNISQGYLDAIENIGDRK